MPQRFFPAWANHAPGAGTAARGHAAQSWRGAPQLVRVSFNGLMPPAMHPSTRLSRCPRCDYNLGALPASHRCPECGFTYDQSMFVLEGWHVPDLLRSARRVLRLAGGFTLVLLALRLALAVPVAILAWLALLGVAGFVLADLYLRLRHGGRTRALARYLITADGVSRLGAAAGRIYLWRNYSHVILLPDGQGAFRLHVYPSWWRLFEPPVVNARLEGLASDADAVRREIERRINASRRDESRDRDPGAAAWQ